MNKNRYTNNDKDTVEYVSVTLPCNAVELLTNQANAGSGLPSAINPVESFSEAMIGRNGAFPHIKKTHWNDQIALRIVHNHS